jgi:hypothetical protein
MVHVLKKTLLYLALPFMLFCIWVINRLENWGLLPPDEDNLDD